MTGDQFKKFRDARAIPSARLAAFLGCGERTIRRYAADKPDSAVAMLLALMEHGKLSLEDVEKITRKVWR